MSSLNLSEYTPKAEQLTQVSGGQLVHCLRVRNLGIVALILAILGIFIPFIADIIALVIAKQAMNISRNKLVPIEYEKPAYWAYRLSIIGIIWWVVIVVRVLL